MKIVYNIFININYTLILVNLLALISCTGPVVNDNPLEQQNIKLEECPPIDSSAIFSNITMRGFIYVDQELKFGVSGITLGVKTPGAENRPSQVSNKGVHLHVVLNDSIHLLHYDNLIPFKLTDGIYQIATFTSRSYHESIKTSQSAMLRNFEVKNGKTVKSFPSPSATLVYGAPLGTFKGEETKNIVLDFFLMNTSLSPQGNKVKVIIDEKFEFVIDDWKAHYITGLIDGTHKIQMELINQRGQLLYGPLMQTIVCDSKLN